MKQNLMTKIINCLSSEKCRRAGRQVLCGVGAATALGIACVLILSVVGIDFKPLVSTAPKLVERNGFYEAETDGFVTRIHVESVGGSGLEGRRLLLASAGVPEISPLQEIGIEKTDEEKKQININVEPVEEGDTYENLKSALLGDAEEGLMPIEVMRLVASDAEGNAIDLSGWKITMEVAPTEELLDKAARSLGMSVKVLPLGGEVTEKFFTNVEVAGNQPLSVKVEYTVPEDGTAMYALCAETVYARKLEKNEDWFNVGWVDVMRGTEVTVDLNGYKITRENDERTNPLFYIWGGTLTIIDSSENKDAGIYAEGLEGIINIQNDGVLNISAGILSNEGGQNVVYAPGEKTVVNMSGGVLTGAIGYWDGGGGIFVKNGIVNISGGTITGNSANRGGGICAKEGTVVISGGKIEENKATLAWSGGGGIWARRIEMSGGIISNNEAQAGGGGVYAISMMMTGGEISGNSAGKSSLGGGGIFITPPDAPATLTENDIVFKFHDDTEESKDEIRCNMSITGGVIKNNESDNTGGGIFVNRGAVVYIRGENGRNVMIEGNTAYDKIEPSGHGYAGGGIFVEHETNGVNVDVKEGGQIYIYNAVITANTARNGGGVAGCGVSSVTICSINGVAVYENIATGTDTQDSRYEVSRDLYVDGEGVVDSMMMGGVQVTWRGKTKTAPETIVDPNQIKDIEPFNEGTKRFDHGFYLYTNELTQPQKDEINKYATVFIQKNESKTGGGGIGGNGFMKLGLKSPDPEDPKGDLKLTKVVNDAKSNSESQKFDFTIHLTDAQNQVLTGSVAYVKGSGSADPDESESMNLKDGSCNFELGDQEYIKIIDLPVGTHYTITETRVEGYMPGIQLTNADGIIEGETVSGWIGTDGSVVYTNTALYELPETGGETAAMYYLLGCALLATAMAGGWAYKRRSH